jgi:hypothetical protein
MLEQSLTYFEELVLCLPDKHLDFRRRDVLHERFTHIFVTPQRQWISESQHALKWRFLHGLLLLLLRNNVPLKTLSCFLADCLEYCSESLILYMLQDPLRAAEAGLVLQAKCWLRILHSLSI